MAIPTSPPWDIANFDETTLASLLGLGASDLSVQPTVTPYLEYDAALNLLRHTSADGVLSTLDFNVAVPGRYTAEITARFLQLPDDFGDVVNHRMGITVADDSSRGVSIYFSKNGLAVSRIDDFGSVAPLPGSGDDIREIDRFFHTVRVAVDAGLGRAYIFIGRSDEAFLPLKYIVPVEQTPPGTLDTLRVFALGTPTDVAQIEMTHLRLGSDLIISNFPPIANAGADQVLPVGQAARLNGRASFDVEGAQITYQWRAVDAPFGSQFAHDNSSGSTIDDGDGDGFTPTLSFVAGTLDVWVAPGDVLLLSGVRHSIATVDDPGGSLTVVADTLPDTLDGAPFRIIRQSLLVGATSETPHVVPDVQGLYRFDLTVNDGETDSEAVEVLVSVVAGRAPFGIEPDVEFLWDAIGDDWQYVEDRTVFLEFWRGTAQLLGGKMLEAWQYHYNFNIGDAQRVFQRKWLAYRTLISESAPDDATISARYGALLALHDFTSGDPVVTGNSLTIEYADSSTPTATVSVTVTFTADDLATIVSDINAALAGTGISAYAHEVRSRGVELPGGSTADDGDADGTTGIFRYTPGVLPAWVAPGDTLVLNRIRYEILAVSTDSYAAVGDGTTVDDGDADGVTDTMTFTPASLPGWVAAGDTLEVGGVRYVIATLNNPGGSLTVTGDVLPDGLAAVDFQIGGVLTITEDGATVADVLRDDLTAAAYALYGIGALGIRAPGKAFQITAASTAAAALGLTTEKYNYLEGFGGARATNRTYRAEPGTDFVLQGVRRGDLLVINNGQAFVVDRVLDDPKDPTANQRLLLTEDLPLDATLEWEVPSVVLSTEVNYETEGSYPGDMVKVEAFDTRDSSTADVSGKVVAQRGLQVAARLDGLFSVLLDTTTYELRLLGVKRRKSFPIDAEVRSIPQLQDKIAQSAGPTLWKENIDYYLEPFYREPDGSAIPMLQFRDSVFIEPDLEPPDIFWAEVTLFSNEANIQALFGRLVGFLQDDAAVFGDDFSYASAVAGQLYAHQKGPHPRIMKTGAQIMFGQPFGEVRGFITEIRDDFSPLTVRILVQDDDGFDPPRTDVVRSYVYKKDPLDLSTTSGLEINPATLAPYAVGDVLEQFAPIGTGVEIIDYINDPTWYVPFVRSGILTEIEKFMTFVVEFNLDLVSIVGLSLVQQFIHNVKPTYTAPILLGVKNIHEDVDVVDVLDMTLTMHEIDSFCTSGRSFIYDDYRGDGTIWSTYGDGFTYYDGIVDCVSDYITFCLLLAWADYAASPEGLNDISKDTVTYPGDVQGLTLDINIEGTVYSTTFTAGAADELLMLAEVNAVLGANGTASFGGAKATGTIGTVPGAAIVDGENFILNDGVNPAVTFEFDFDGSVTPTPTLRQISILGVETADDIRDLIVTAVTAAPTLDISVIDISSESLLLQNDALGVAGNLNITTTTTMVVAGMIGGTLTLKVTSALVGILSYVEFEQTTSGALFTLFGLTLGPAFNARIIGTADLSGATYPGDFSANTLQVIIDGGAPVNVVFSGGVATAEDVRDEINTAVGSTVAAIDGLNRLVLFSNTTGIASEVEVGAGTTASLLTVFGVTGATPVFGDVYTTRASGNVITNNAGFFYDTLIEAGTIAGAPPVFTPSGVTFYPTYGMPLLAGDYRVCVEIDSGNDVLP